jgi:hypothetical protein
MALTDIFPNSRLHAGRFPAFRGVLSEQRSMNLGGAESTGFPHDDISILVVPLEDGPWTNAEPLPHFGGNGDLALRCQFGLSDGHCSTLPW